MSRHETTAFQVNDLTRGLAARPGRRVGARGFALRAAGWLAASALVLGAALGATPARAQSEEASSHYPAQVVTAAALFQFARFTRWPQSAFDDEQAPFRICVLGKDPFGAALEALKGKHIGGRDLQVTRLRSVGEAKPCQLVFISGSESGRLSSILGRLRSRPILTVAEMPNFTDAGGIINLSYIDERLQFSINPSAARASGLKLSAQLYRLARNRDGDMAQAPSRGAPSRGGRS